MPVIIYRVGDAIIEINAKGLVSEREEGVVMVRGKKRRLTDANLRAHKLLMEYLDKRQRTSFEEEGYFKVTSQHGNQYLLWEGSTMAAKTIEVRGRPRKNCCIILPGYSEFDALLARKMMLENDEDRFIRTACW